MVINLVLVAGTVVLGLIGDPTTPGSSTGYVAPAAVKVAARDSFSPPPKAKKRPAARPRPPGGGAQPEAPVEDEVDEDQPPARKPAAAPVRRRPAVEEMESEAVAEEEEEEEEKPRNKKKRKRVAEEEEEEDEDDDAPMASMPVVLPRLFSVQAGFSAIGRSFGYDTALQKESTFPRPGVGLTVEAYPMLRMPRGWHKKLGIGVNLAMEFGAAALANPTTGASTSFPVSQLRWSGDVRYVVPAGERVVLVPSVGYGRNSFDLKTIMPNGPPSACTNSSTMPCLADIKTSYFIFAAHLRIAATESLSLSLSLGYFLGLGVDKGVGQIGSDQLTETKLAGYHIEPGANIMLKDWLALRVSIPYTHYGYTFTSQMQTYKSATENYYGLTGGVLLFMP